MGVSFSVSCTRCGVEAPEVGDFGYIGIPTTDPRKRRASLRSFAAIHEGLAALGMLTHEVEAFHAFLEAHRGHPLRQFNDHGDEEFEADAEDSVSPGRSRAFRFQERFPDAFHELSCSCGAAYRAGSSEPLRPFEPFVPARKQLACFKSNVLAIDDDNFYRVAGFPFDDLRHIADFLEKHSGHTITARLTTGETSPSLAPRGGTTGEPAWTPPAWKAEESERALGPVSDTAALYDLHDRDAAVRASGASKLGRLGEAGALGYLVSLLDDPESSVRVAAVRAVGLLPDPRRARALGHALSDEAEEVRAAVRQALAAATIPEEEALHRSRSPQGPYADGTSSKVATDREALTLALRDPRWSVRSLAVEKLEALQGKDAVELLLVAGGDPAPGVRDGVPHELARHDDPRAVAALLRMLRDRALMPHSAAVKALGAGRVSAGIPALRDLLLAADAGNTSSYWGPGGALREIGGAAAAAALTDALAHPQADVRGHVCWLLGELRDSSTGPAVARLLADPDEHVRGAATRTLAALGVPPPLPPLVQLYWSRSADDRSNAIRAISGVPGVGSLTVLVAALRDRSGSVRRIAAEAVMARKEARGRRALLAAARRGDADAALMAWPFLLATGDPATESALEAALSDDGFERADEMAAAFVSCGNARLAKAARRWLDGRRPGPGRTVLWGTARPKR